MFRFDHSDTTLFGPVAKESRLYRNRVAVTITGGDKIGTNVVNTGHIKALPDECVGGESFAEITDPFGRAGILCDDFTSFFKIM